MNQRTRYAYISYDQGAKLETVRRYLPSNYTASYGPRDILIIGQDVAGWTLDDYVIPRLASGNIYAKEI